MNRTTVFLSDEHINQVSEEAERTRLKSAEIIRNALTWYFAFRNVTRDSFGEFTELLKVYEEMTPEQILIKLIADDKRLRAAGNKSGQRR